ncbi:unnamed protein product [Rotaria magnacalcarata]|uniref:Tartrate-resistant acid phosphatase type 5 n=3 Tax=Rotaria magnacalcarata TaxID=392030 RepID=A0A817A132_9BILA|nr:unnamed protein product [Rotaria magnacalcarata]CAF1961403.1 unnamed protein product [Rotaria magnacalcarata]CAF2236627.1 unnamed protein product [Rotaria magnacalcarata]CAF4025802.1 unnamed protein product [Rotaria magnacalcarata]CAF4066583.1 unnamed protein product [Rotaria magnacalcarata]
MCLLFLFHLVIFYQFSTVFSTNFGQYDLVAHENNDGTTRFFVVGDWGGLPFLPYETPSEVAIAEAMGKMGKKLNTSFQLALGDNFYFDGVQSAKDPRFQNTFEHVFSATSLQTPWYVIAGNHDHLGNVSAQIEYGKTSKRWVFPDYFYSFSLWQNDKQKKLIDFVMIDTVILCGGGNLSDWEHTALEGPRNENVAEAYWQWIEEQLRQSTAPYLIVSGHFPIYSVAEHGPTQCLIDRLRPLLHQYQATTYLCGHDHNLQHLVDDMNGTHLNYFVVGAANFIDNSHAHEQAVPPNSLKFFWAGSILFGGFGLIEVDNTQMNFSFIDRSEKTLYQLSMKPRF